MKASLLKRIEKLEQNLKPVEPINFIIEPLPTIDSFNSFEEWEKACREILNEPKSQS